MSRSSIRRRIRQKKSEIRTCERVISQVKREIGRINDQISRWTRQQGLLNAEESTAVVVLRNQYEGTTAVKNHENFYEGLNCKHYKEGEINELIDDAYELNQNIRHRIAELEDEIEWLYSCLDDD